MESPASGAVAEVHHQFKSDFPRKSALSVEISGDRASMCRCPDYPLRGSLPFRDASTRRGPEPLDLLGGCACIVPIPRIIAAGS